MALANQLNKLRNRQKRSCGASNLPTAHPPTFGENGHNCSVQEFYVHMYADVQMPFNYVYNDYDPYIDIGKCSGSCAGPIYLDPHNTSVPSRSHIVYMLYQIMNNPPPVAYPSCQPASFSDICLFEENVDSLAIVKYRDFRIASCKCI